MRTLGRALAVSLAAHAAAGALLGRGEPVLRGLEPARPRLEPIEVALVNVPVPVPESEGAGAGERERGHEGERERGRAGERGSGSERGRGGEREIGHGHGHGHGGDANGRKLAMRYRGPLDLAVKPGAPASDVVVPETGGPPGVRSRTDLGPTVGRTDPLGRVRFDDRPNLRLKLPGKRMLGAIVDSWLADPYGTSAERSPDRPLPGAAPKTRNEKREYQAKNTFIIPVTVSGSFDLTDALMRGAGQDPYSAKKLAFMDATREERAQIARRRQAVDLADAVASLRANLERLWARRDLGAAERRQILFELWDECAERGTPDELDAAQVARQTVLGFIRRRLPRGSADAYSAAELRSLNARRESKQRFDPYADDAAR